MRRVSAPIALGGLLVALLAAAPAQATTRYVTTGGTANDACAQATPCTLEQAVERVAGAGDEVIVAPGTYPVSDSLTLDRRIDLHGSDPRARPLVSKGPASNDDPTVTINAAGSRLAGIDVVATEVFNTAILANANATIENLVTRAMGDFGEALFVTSGPLLVRNAMARSFGESGTAIVFNSGSGGTLRGVTAIASGPPPGSSGLQLSGGAIDARNVLLRGTGSDAAVASNGRLTLTSSNFRLASTTVDPGSSLVQGAGNQTAADPTLFSTTDAHQRLASVTRNAGTADALIGDTDLDGQPRSAEGAPDIGADEFPELPVGPQLPADNLLQNPGADAAPGAADEDSVVAPPAWAVAGPFTAVAYGSPGFPDLAERDRVRGGAQLFAGGPNTPSSQAVQLVDLKPYATAIDAGRATATLGALLGGYELNRDAMEVVATFTDGAGAPLGAPIALGPVTPEDRGGETVLVYRQGSAAVPAGARGVEVRMTATRYDGLYDDGYADSLALTLAIEPAGQGPGPDDPPPILSAFSATRTRFAVAKASASARRRSVPRGTTLRFTLSEAATLAVAVERAKPGRRSGGRCAAPRRALRRRPRCTRYVRAGVVRYAGRGGANRVPFSGRIGRRALPPGRYRLTATAVDAAGQRSNARRIAIRIVPAR